MANAKAFDMTAKWPAGQWPVGQMDITDYLDPYTSHTDKKKKIHFKKYNTNFYSILFCMKKARNQAPISYEHASKQAFQALLILLFMAMWLVSMRVAQDSQSYRES